MQYIIHLFGFLPQLSNAQLVMTALVWIGCYVWRATTGIKVPAATRVDSAFGVQVTSGSKGPGRPSTHRQE